ncbi:ribosome biogenesis GTPase [Orenia metallireducens]|uniref:Ribosome biogenesis GTPase n=1 Tax=Orenia metallireducens TaxID=1413210 RepID=A0A285F2B1_9FIRM|nr:ribosome small subunit-dependent GTPase A [Orenia metallireducens]PRX34743.1 ribosome biogenesis GTPase [Orenia metallireducens]SNY05450.1 ribosome biogenesis GTPase [Orenia metallireducens]
MLGLRALGWKDSFTQELEQISLKQENKIGRIVSKYQNIYKIYTEDGEVLGQLAERRSYNYQMPVVGDWVLVSLVDDNQAMIERILTRQSSLSNNILGNTLEEQILVVNIDTLFIIVSLAQELNLRNIQRQITLAWESGCTPVIILSQADLCNNAALKKSEVELISLGTPVHLISIERKEGVEELKQYLKFGQTYALIGAVGVGKSTLSNYLVTQKGELNQQRETINSEMIILKDGGVVIELNCMEEAELLAGEGASRDNFEDIEELAKGCYFSDCRHEVEPNCAIKEAIEEGMLDEQRLKNYRKLQKEREYLELSKKHSPKELEKSKWKQIIKGKERTKEKVK